MIYISYSTNYKNSAEIVYNELLSQGQVPKMWTPNVAYNNTWIETAEVIIFVLEDLKFKQELNSITLGQKKEILRALSLRKPIYIAYKTADGTLNFYNCEFKLEKDKIYISGKPGTKSNIINILSNFNVSDWINMIAAVDNYPKNTLYVTSDTSVRINDDSYIGGLCKIASTDDGCLRIANTDNAWREITKEKIVDNSIKPNNCVLEFNSILFKWKTL